MATATGRDAGATTRVGCDVAPAPMPVCRPQAEGWPGLAAATRETNSCMS